MAIVEKIRQIVNVKWWTLGSAYRLEADHLRAVIDASLSLIGAGQVEPAEALLKSFSSELAEVGPTVDQGMAEAWTNSGRTNGRSAS